jgi:hypothetical protein
MVTVRHSLMVKSVQSDCELQPAAFEMLGKPNYGLAWLLLCFAFILHVWDEAAHNFLTYYNATAIALANEYDFLPRLDMSYKTWLVGLIVANAILLTLTPLAYSNSRWLRPVAYIVAVIQTLNGVHHILFFFLGHSIGGIVFAGPAPGVYSSPTLIATAAYLFCKLYQISPRRRSVDVDYRAAVQPDKS